jgi:O-antigen/teichoic acid export membrane protein
LKSAIVKNTLTNYLTVAIRLPHVILMTRWMLAFLGREYYGFWALLWSFFVYSLLLDFGFGVSLRKYTAMGLYETDPERYNKIISTVLAIYLAMAVLIVAATFAAAAFLELIIRVNDPEQLQYFKKCFLLFGSGTAVVFVTAGIPEILVGMQKIYIRNYVNVFARLAEFIGAWIILFSGAGLITLILFTITVLISSNLVMGLYVLKHIPRLRISPRLEKEVVREIMGFSGFVYLNSVCNLIMNKSGDLLVSVYHGLSAVGVYHLAGRFPDLCGQAVAQYEENFSPITAALYTKGEHGRLRATMLNSMRWGSFMASFFLFTAWFLCEDALYFLFKVQDTEVTNFCKVFLILMFVTTACEKFPRDFLLMTEKHRRLALVSVLEALASLSLALILLKFYSAQCLVWIAICVKIMLLLLLILPKVMKYLECTWWTYLRKVYLMPIAAMIIPVFLIENGKKILPPESSSFVRLAFCGTGALVCYLIIAYIFLLSRGEKLLLKRKFKYFL